MFLGIGIGDGYLLIECLLLLGLMLIVFTFIVFMVAMVRHDHPFQEYRSREAKQWDVPFKKAEFVQIGPNAYLRCMEYGIENEFLVFRKRWFFGQLWEYFAIPLCRIEMSANINQALVEAHARPVVLKMDASLAEDLERSLRAFAS